MERKDISSSPDISAAGKPALLNTVAGEIASGATEALGRIDFLFAGEKYVLIDAKFAKTIQDEITSFLNLPLSELEKTISASDSFVEDVVGTITFHGGNIVTGDGVKAKGLAKEYYDKFLAQNVAQFAGGSISLIIDKISNFSILPGRGDFEDDFPRLPRGFSLSDERLAKVVSDSLKGTEEIRKKAVILHFYKTLCDHATHEQLVGLQAEMTDPNKHSALIKALRLGRNLGPKSFWSPPKDKNTDSYRELDSYVTAKLLEKEIKETKERHLSM
jgi:hypothetical protein